MFAIESAREKIHALIWGDDLNALTGSRRQLVLTIRMLHAVVRDLGEGHLNLVAMSLVYTTLLSLVPLLALAFSVLKGFGVHNQIEPALAAALAPLGEKGAQLTHNIVGFVDNIRVGVLGAVGLGLLIYTVTSLMQKIEHAFNTVWRVKQQRPLAQRFSQYLSVITIGPLLVFSAMGITGMLLNSQAMLALMDIPMLGAMFMGIGKILPYLLVIAAFAFIYSLMPNTRVPTTSALVGAAVGGILWQSLGWAFATIVAASASYTAIYAGFAIVILGMVWLYLNWLVVLIGASVAYYHQNPAQLATPIHEPRMSNRVKEKLALLSMANIGGRFENGGPAWSLDALAAQLDTPASLLDTVLATLTQAGLLVETGDSPATYVPARPLEHIGISALLEAVRSAEESTDLPLDSLPQDSAVDDVFERMELAVNTGLAGLTVKDLVPRGQE